MTTTTNWLYPLQVYVKYVVESVEMTTWSRVYYNNVLSIPPTFVLGYFFGEFDFLQVRSARATNG